MAKKVVKSGIPVFTMDYSECTHLHELGISGFTRKTVAGLLNKMGVKKKSDSEPKETEVLVINEPPIKPLLNKKSKQLPMF